MTGNIGATTVIWTAVGVNPPVNACGIRAGGTSADPVFTVQAGTCNGSDADQLWRFTGTSSTGNWQQIQPPGNIGGFGVFSVDRSDPTHVIASHFSGPNVSMIQTMDGGATWQNLPALDALMEHLRES